MRNVTAVFVSGDPGYLINLSADLVLSSRLLLQGRNTTINLVLEIRNIDVIIVMVSHLRPILINNILKNCKLVTRYE